MAAATAVQQPHKNQVRGHAYRQNDPTSSLAVAVHTLRDWVWITTNLNFFPLKKIGTTSRLVRPSSIETHNITSQKLIDCSTKSTMGL
jgi:hypothetical protein